MQSHDTMLRWRFVDTTELTPSERDAMAALYKAHHDCDAATARERISATGRACLFRQPKSARIEAFFIQSASPRTIDGESLVLVKLASFYARKSARGDVSLVLAALQSMLRMWLRHPRARWFAVSDVIEPSYRWYKKNLREVWSLPHPQLPARERRILEHAATMFASVDRARGTVLTPCSKVAGDAPPRDDDAGREFRRLLPAASANEGLLVIGELSVRNALPTLRRALRRALRVRVAIVPGRSAARRGRRANP